MATPSHSSSGISDPPGRITAGRRDAANAALYPSASSQKPNASTKMRKKTAGYIGLAFATLVWYGLTILYSVYNTAVLQVFPFPLTVLAAELGAGVLMILPAWVLGIVRTPNLRMSQV